MTRTVQPPTALLRKLERAPARMHPAIWEAVRKRMERVPPTRAEREAALRQSAIEGYWARRMDRNTAPNGAMSRGI